MRIFLLFLLAAMSVPVLADVANSIRIDNAFARAAIQQQRNSAAFMTLVNSGDAARIVSAKSPVARIVELHTHIDDRGVMRMRKIDSIDLPAGEQVVLKPGGLHVMLLGLNRDLKVDDSIALTLGFNDGSERVLKLPVRKVMMHHKMRMHGSTSMQKGMMGH